MDESSVEELVEAEDVMTSGMHCIASTCTPTITWVSFVGTVSVSDDKEACLDIVCDVQTNSHSLCLFPEINSTLIRNNALTVVEQ